MLKTQVGELCIELLGDDAPRHVENFKFYINQGLTAGTFFHRIDGTFVLQGGTYRKGSADYGTIPALNGTVQNEPCTLDIPDPGGLNVQVCSERGNVQGTIALAKRSNDPDSGTTGWFINLGDNRANLDNQNGGFTVFGRLVGNSYDTVEAIAALYRTDPAYFLWLQTSVLPSSFAIPLLSNPTFGCWDASKQVALLRQSALPASLAVEADPVLSNVSFFPFMVSAECGTTIVPNPTFSQLINYPGSCPDIGTGIRVDSASSLSISNVANPAVAFTCGQIDESLQGRSQWLDAYPEIVAQNVVLIETADIIVVAEDSQVPALSALFAVAMTLSVGAIGFILQRRARQET